MLRGTMAYIDRYTSLSPLFAQVMSEIQAIDWTERTYGKYALADGKAWVTYSLCPHQKENAVFEAHNRYIDVQCIVDGDELMGWADRSRLIPQTEYDPDKDCQLFTGAGDTLRLVAGDWVLFFPEDAHAPCGTLTRGESVKLVAKIPVDGF